MGSCNTRAPGPTNLPTDRELGSALPHTSNLEYMFLSWKYGTEQIYLFTCIHLKYEVCLNNIKNSVITAQKAYNTSTANPNWLMLFIHRISRNTKINYSYIDKTYSSQNVKAWVHIVTTMLCRIKNRNDRPYRTKHYTRINNH
jgi:hypothetical protein